MSEKSKTVIKGEQIVLKVKGKPIAHALSHSLKCDLELKSLLTKNTDGEEKTPGNISWSIDAESMVVIDESLKATHHSADEIFELFLNKEIVELVIESPIIGAMKSYKGNAYITSCSNGATVNEEVKCSLSFTGSGNLQPATASAQVQSASAPMPAKL